MSSSSQSPNLAPINSGTCDVVVGDMGMSPIDGEDDHVTIVPTASSPAKKKTRVFVIVCILLMELCERMTFYSITANLVLFCTSKLGMTDPDATTVQYVFGGSCYLIPVVGGWIADTVAGKFNTIYGAGLIYIVGSFMLVVSAIDYTDWLGRDKDGEMYGLDTLGRSWYYLGGLGLVAVGTGGIKANVGPYGALQAEDLGENAVQSFFNWFYFFINTGSFIANSVVAYVQQNISFAYGYLIPLLSMILSLIILNFGRAKYTDNPPEGSLLTTAVKMVAQGYKRRKEPMKGDSFLDRVKRSNGGSFPDATVDGVKCLGRVIPVYLTFIIYWTTYGQMTSTFYLQSLRMDVRIGSLLTPVAALSLIDTVIILILIPLMDRVVFPALAKVNIRPTMLQRIGLGYVLATLAMVYAGVLEIFRKENLSETGGFIQILADKEYNSSTLSMFYQVPQFALVGASEVFASITGLQFAYSQAPTFMKGLMMGLFLVMSGLGNYLLIAITQIVEAASSKEKPWYPDEINKGYTEYFYFLLAGVMLLDFLVFLVIARQYKYSKVPEEEEHRMNRIVDPEKKEPPDYESTHL